MSSESVKSALQAAWRPTASMGVRTGATPTARGLSNPNGGSFEDRRHPWNSEGQEVVAAELVLDRRAGFHHSSLTGERTWLLANDPGKAVSRASEKQTHCLLSMTISGLGEDYSTPARARPECGGLPFVSWLMLVEILGGILYLTHGLGERLAQSHPVSKQKSKELTPVWL